MRVRRGRSASLRVGQPQVLRDHAVAPAPARPARRGRPDARALTRWSGEPSAGTSTPAGSSTSRKRTAPSPTRQPGPARRHGRPSAPGVTARAARAPRSSPSPRGGERLAAAGVEHREHRGRRLGRARRARAASRRRRARRPLPCASARAVATPMRRPVNVPGPGADRDAVEVGERQARPRRAAARASGSSCAAWPGRSPGRGVVARLARRRSPSSSATTVAGVAVSKREDASSPPTPPRSRAPVAARVLERHAHRGRPARRLAAASGHSTNATWSALSVVGEQRRVLVVERSPAGAGRRGRPGRGRPRSGGRS